MAQFSYQLKGFGELHKVLDKLPERVQGRVQQGAASAGARVLRKYVKAAAPVGEEQSVNSKKYGRLKDNIRVIRLKRNSPGERQARVDTGNAFWGVILELGSIFIPANPWFSRGISSGTAPALQAVQERMATGIIKEADKLMDETGASRVK